MTTFYGIKNDALKQAPVEIRKFIKCHFEKRNLFGIPCLVAINDANDVSPWQGTEDDDGQKEDAAYEWLKSHPEVAIVYGY